MAAAMRLAWLLPCLACALDSVSLVQQPPHYIQKIVSDRFSLQHRQRLRRHRPVLYLHLHKAGGTSMCQLARDNQEILMWAVDELSCNWIPFDDYKGWSPLHRPDCMDRYFAWEASGFTWSQIERPFLAQDFCPEQFAYATTLRHPVETALSMVNFVDPESEWRGWQFRAVMDCLERRAAGEASACIEADFLHSVGFVWLYFDNPMVRMLGGLDVWNLPPGQVNATHTEKAMEVLSRFDLVLFLEDLSSRSTLQRLGAAFGWSNFSTSHVNKGVERRVNFTGEDAARVERLNAQDMQLYGAARARHLNTRGSINDQVNFYLSRGI